MMKLLERLALWILTKVRKEVLVAATPRDQVLVDAQQLVLDKTVLALKDPAFFVVKQVENKFKAESGEFKRSQAMRMLMNIQPEAIERDIALAIELAVRKCV